ncbi:MAG TPA: response regulator transcription factor [Gaiellales bacterium]|jgi:two-component system response regulator RegX3|nr:response regulator transcription factor [Gaiellales bacterium]
MEAGGQRPVATRGHVTVIEDEASISDPLRSALEREGYAVSVEPTGNGGLESVRRGEPDIVLLDLNLPDLDGRDVCRAIRQTSDVPIIMLTARGLETDRVVGLELGADDYLVKPFSMAELIARIRAVLRRTGDRATPVAAAVATPTAIEIGDVAIDPATHVATHAGTTVDLPRREFDLLHVLMAHAGTVLARNTLMDEVWGVDWFGSTKTLDVHIAGLRRRLGDDAHEPRYIHTVRGVGFRFASPAELAG